MSVKTYFFLFLVYAIIGWLIEVVGGIIQTKKFVNRGFMIGPYCPIYGIGGVLITILLKSYTRKSICFILCCNCNMWSFRICNKLYHGEVF